MDLNPASHLIREVSLSESSKVDALVSEAFGYSAPHRYFQDFPIWNSDQVLRLGIFEQDQLISHVGVHFAQMQLSQRLEPVALIGAVATDSSHRAKGLSSALMKEAVKRIDLTGAQWSFLWGSEHAFYSKFGFSLAGEQTRGSISRIEPGFQPFNFSEIKSGMNEAIFNLLKSSLVGIKLNESDRSWIFNQKTVQWYFLENPFAFVAFERGLDLKHLVHEWGGDMKAVLKLLSFVHSQDSSAEVMGKKSELQKLGLNRDALIEEHLCLARPKNESDLWDPEFWISGINGC